MRAVALSRFGGPEVLQVRDLATPSPGPGEILVKVAYAGVNPADWKDREGLTAAFMGATFPYTPGFDAAGTVAAIGSEVTHFEPGDRVFTASDHGQGKPGSYAEYVLASDTAVAAVPDALPLDVAACIPVAGLTAWQALFAPDKGALPQDAAEPPVVFVNGGAGGVGSFAVQFARHAGARVVASCGPDNIAYVQQLGAERVIDYRQGTAADALRQAYPDGVDLLLDAVGASSLAAPLELVKRGGTLVSVPTLVDDGDVDAAIAAATAAGKRKVFAFMNDRNVKDELTLIADLLVTGTIRAPQIKHFALDEVARAHRQLQAGHVRGKLVLAISEDP